MTAPTIAPTPAPAPSPVTSARQIVSGTFAGTPGRLRLFGAGAIAACVLFGVFGFTAATRLHTDINNMRDDAAQLVRVQAIRTSLVKADANATNAFLVGGLEPSDVRAAYADGIASAARTLTDASGANASDAAALRNVSRLVAEYDGLVESARANNRQGFPVGAAYLRQASNMIQTAALPPLASLGAVEERRVADAVRAADSALLLLEGFLLVALVVLVFLQYWLYRKTRRVFNPSLVVASVLVLVLGVVGVGIMVWARDDAESARDGAYHETVALATARINGFDAKSAEALTLIARGSGQPYEDRFQTVSKAAGEAVVPTTFDGSGTGSQQLSTVVAFRKYLEAHKAVRALDDGGSWDQAVAAATGSGAANRAFANFEQVSRAALDKEANALSEDLDGLLAPLTAMSWILLLAGLVAAGASWRGINIRLGEYR